MKVCEKCGEEIDGKDGENYCLACDEAIATGKRLKRQTQSQTIASAGLYLRIELERARQNALLYEHDGACAYWLGVIDGLIRSMHTFNIPTTLPKRKTKNETN